MKTNQKGFTLVEIAIVLVIIGLLLGGVLKGQALINNAKIKSTIDMYKAASAATYGYMDRYSYLPGDDPNEQTRWSGLPATGDGDGSIEGGYCSADNEESCLALRVLRYAQLISGDPSVAQPHLILPIGGKADIFTYTLNGQRSVWFAMQGIAGEDAQQIDLKLDDGKCNSGTMQRYSGSACNGTEYDPTGTYASWIKM